KFRFYPVESWCCKQTATNLDGSFWFCKCSPQRNSQIRVLRLAWAVDHTSHDGNFHLFHAGVASLPHRHLLAKIGLNLLGHFLEEGACGASATGTSSDLRAEAADSEGLQNLLRD